NRVLARRPDDKTHTHSRFNSMRQRRGACCPHFFRGIRQLHPACPLPDGKLLRGGRTTSYDDLRKFSVRSDERSLERAFLDAVMLAVVIHFAAFPERTANRQELPGPLVSFIVREKVSVSPLFLRRVA